MITTRAPGGAINKLFFSCPRSSSLPGILVIPGIRAVSHAMFSDEFSMPAFLLLSVHLLSPLKDARVLLDGRLGSCDLRDTSDFNFFRSPEILGHKQ